MFKGFFFCCLVVWAGFGAEFPLRERLTKAKSGDFIVFEANKTITLLAIRSLSEQSLVLEEISAPVMNKRPDSWSDWIRSKAPGHTSWSMIEIDLRGGQVLECYSFTRNAWLSQSPQDSFLATLLHLPLTPIDKKKLRRIGSPPIDGADHRQIWQPTLVIDGKEVKDAHFAAFETIWPQDHSELSGKAISLYFDQESLSPLPCWIQIDMGTIAATLRAIDSGQKLPPSLYRSMPRRVPEFISAPTQSKQGFRLAIKSPKYYKSFDLFAVDITSREKQICPIAHSVIPGDGDTMILQVAMEELNHALQPNHKYTWLVVPTGYHSSYTEFQKPFTWMP